MEPSRDVSRASVSARWYTLEPGLMETSGEGSRQGHDGRANEVARLTSSSVGDLFRPVSGVSPGIPEGLFRCGAGKSAGASGESPGCSR